MRLLQATQESGPRRLGIVDGDDAFLLERSHEGIATCLDLLEAMNAGRTDPRAWRTSAEKAGAFRKASWNALTDGRDVARLAAPLSPPEVWGAGVTYKRSAEFREEGTGIYDRIYAAERPELFFKATASRCVGPGQAIGKRRDSTFTATEPELAVVLSSTGVILGYTLANDVSAWDIERDNPLYLPQSKVYDGCFAFGPVIVTADEFAPDHAFDLRCVVMRGAKEIFAGSASTLQLNRRIPDLVAWLRRSNAIPTGTVLSTGTGIIQPLGAGLEEGDVVTISCADLGVLRNPVALV
jgi:2-dehydro-3-deoxy-D-arabinonate dehydratase